MSSPPDRLTRDLQRDVHCLFGLPVDNLTMAQTRALLRERCTQEGSTVLATINVNWVAESFRDPTFRDAIINSDLVVLDGKPLLWLARLLGCPMRETVPGSTLIQELLDEPSDQPLTIFLFGGEGDVAERAMQRINERQRGGLRAVGALNPGFGSMEEMSSEAIIEAINATAPDILLVALGAKKGTRWIERNRNRLNAKIISHLGATINFLAGTVRRAPRFLQRYGLEWLWRILHEPTLVSRYSADGLAVIRFLLPRLTLWWQYRRCLKNKSSQQTNLASCLQERQDGFLCTVGPNLQKNEVASLRLQIIKSAPSAREIILDLRHTIFVDMSFWALLILLLRSDNNQGKRIFLVNGKALIESWGKLAFFQQFPISR